MPHRKEVNPLRIFLRIFRQAGMSFHAAGSRMAVPAALHPQAVCGMNRGFRRAAEHRIRKALVG